MPIELLATYIINFAWHKISKSGRNVFLCIICRFLLVRMGSSTISKYYEVWKRIAWAVQRKTNKNKLNLTTKYALDVKMLKRNQRELLNWNPVMSSYMWYIGWFLVLNVSHNFKKLHFQPPSQARPNFWILSKLFSWKIHEIHLQEERPSSGEQKVNVC